MKQGRCGTMTHDYKRHGTTTLFAALDVKAGTVIGQCMLRHRAAEFIRFLRLIDLRTPPDLDLHLIADNYAAHKTEAVKRWLARHPRFHMHFTPTSASWLNAAETLFAAQQAPAEARRLPLGPRTKSGHPRVHRRPQRRPQAVHLDRSRRHHHRQTPAREASAGIAPLAFLHSVQTK